MEDTDFIGQEDTRVNLDPQTPDEWDVPTQPYAPTVTLSKGNKWVVLQNPLRLVRAQ